MSAGRPSLASLVGLHTPAYYGSGVSSGPAGIDPAALPSRGARLLLISFPKVSFASFNTDPKQKISVQPQTIFRPTQLCIDPYSARFYDIVDFRIGRNSQLVGGAVGSLVPAIAFHAFAVQNNTLQLDTCNVGMLIELEVQRNARKLRLCVTARDGADPPEDWHEVDEHVRRLHYAHPRVVNEIDVPYDGTWEVPDWCVARVADYEKDVGEELDEPLLEDLTFRAYLKGVTIDR